MVLMQLWVQLASGMIYSSTLVVVVVAPFALGAGL
jgi:hypothetical protein